MLCRSDLAVYDESEVLLASSLSTTDDESVTYVATTDGFVAIEVNADTTIVLDATFDPAEGVVEMVLHDPSGAQAASGGASITHTAGSSGSWTVGFSLAVDAGSNTGNGYDFELSL